MGDFKTLVEELYREEYDRLCGIGMEKLKDAYMAEDAVEEVFLTILKHRIWWSSQNKEVRIKYAEHICRLVCNKFLEKRNQVRLIEFKEDVPDDNDTQAGEIIEKETISNYLGSLKESDRNIFECRYCKEMSVKEIAAECNLTENTVSQRLSRGRRRLKMLHEENISD